MRKKKNFMKRCLGGLLSLVMVFSLFAGMGITEVKAASASDIKILGGEYAPTGDDPVYLTTTAEGNVLKGGTAENYNIKITANGTAYDVELNNATITGSANGIEVSGFSTTGLNIELVGENSITTTDNYYGIKNSYCYAPISITGPGSLNVQTDAGYCISGNEVSVTIDGGATVWAKSANGKGIEVYARTLSVKGNSNVTAEGKVGGLVSNTIVIERSNVTASSTGDSGAMDSAPKVTDGTITASTNSDGSDPVDYDPSKYYSYKWIQVQAKSHTHNWNYAADGSSLKAYCTEQEGDCEYQGPDADLKNAVTLTLTATSPAYSGSPVTVCTDGTDGNAAIQYDLTAWTDAGLEAPGVTYVGRGTTDYTESETAPTAVGTYTVNMTVGSATATADFEITKIDPAVTAPSAVASLTYDGSAKALVTAGSTSHGTLKYALSGDGEFSSDIPTGTDAGTYHVYYKVEGNATCSDKVFETPVAVSIAKASYEGTKTATGDILAGYASSDKEVVLPEIPDHMSYGTPVYSVPVTSATVENGNVKYSANNTAEASQSYTITVPVTEKSGESANYSDYNITITLTGVACSHSSTTPVAAVEATCTTDGVKAYDLCSVCGSKLVGGEIKTEEELKLTKTGHAWEYTASGATLAAACSNDNSHTAALTLKATNPTYSGDGVTTGWKVGETVAFTLTGEEEWKALLGNDSVPAIQYIGTEDTTYEESETAPTEVGTYKATITTNSKTAELVFEIKPLDETDKIFVLAKEIVISKIENLQVSNLTTDRDIENAIKTALLSEEQTKSVESEITVAKTPAAIGTDGQIAITVKLSLNDKDITFNLNKTITALVGKNLTVTVKDGNDTAISDASVKVMLGNTKKAEKTSSGDGSCTFPGLASGLYNVVVTKDGVTTTVVADLTTGDNTVSAVLNTDSKGSSHLKVEEAVVPKAAVKVAETVVNNLDALAEALKETDPAVDSYKVEMAVEAKADTTIAQSTQNKMVVEANKGETAAEKATNIDYLDIVIKKTITRNSVEQAPELVTDTGNTIIKIIIPFDFTGKTKVKVLREHNGVVKKFDETNTGADGTYEIDKAKGLIILYSTNFSTYAVSYVAEGESALAEPTAPTVPSGGGSGSVSVPATGITVETDKIEITKAGGTAAIQVTVQPSNATDKKLTFTSSDEKVAKVDTNGVITAVGNGTATITVKTANGITKTITVTVNVPSNDNKDEGISPSEEAVTPEKAAANTIAINKGLKVSQTGSKINVSWGKVADADGYLVYAAYCGTDFGKAVKTVKDPSKVSATITKLNGEKLDAEKNFKVYVKAYKLVDGKKVAFGKSITTHIVGVKNTKNTNVKDIKLTSKSKLTLAVGKTSKIQAKAVLADPAKKQLSDAHAAQFRYASSNQKVATVDKNGKITAKAKGTCYIYVYAKNGNAKSVKVTVK